MRRNSTATFCNSVQEVTSRRTTAMKLVIFLSIFLTSEMVLADTHAVQYTVETFPIEMAKKDHFVMFYATWCNPAQVLLPIWDQLAERMDGIEGGKVRIAKVDCGESNEVCLQNHITASPTLKFFRAGNSTGIRYNMGRRNLESLMRFINQQTKSFRVVVTTRRSNE